MADGADITDQIIAMGYPSEKVEALYRNPYKGERARAARKSDKNIYFFSFFRRRLTRGGGAEVYSFFEKFHKDKYKGEASRAGSVTRG